jgi:hypothetical protein
MRASLSGSSYEEFRLELRKVDDSRLSVKSSLLPDPLSLAVPYRRDEVEEILQQGFDSDLRSSRRTSTDPVMQMGETLFNALFEAQLGRLLRSTLAQIENEDRGLRLRVHSSEPIVQALPWELLFDYTRGDFLSLSSRIALVRSRPEGWRDTALPPLSTLRVLAAEADAPGNLDTAKDIDVLEKLAARYPNVFRLDVLTRATIRSFTERIASGGYDVVHFAGTGLTIRRGHTRVDQGLAFLQDSRATRDRNPDSLDSDALVGLLRDTSVRLFVANACHTDWVARAASKAVTAAVGIRSEVTGPTRLSLCESFYRALASGSSLEAALTVTRQAMNYARPGTREWAMLTVYLQQPDGDLLAGPEDDTLFAVERAERTESRTKEWKLAAWKKTLLQQNLDALRQRIANLSEETSAPFRSQAEELRRKIADLDGQLKRFE